jgi:cellulose synthase (UDP-forming)
MTPDSATPDPQPTPPGGAARAVVRGLIGLVVLPRRERRPWPFEDLPLWSRLRAALPSGLLWHRAVEQDPPHDSLHRLADRALARYRTRTTSFIDTAAGHWEGLVNRLPGATKGLALVALVLLGAFATLPLELPSQAAFGFVLLGLGLLLRDTTAEATQPLLMGLSLLATARYIYWRAAMTLGLPGSAEWWLALGLLAAESYTWVVLLLGYLQNARPLGRTTAALPLDRSNWPTVDVFIPTYNEALSVVRPTLQAALALDWPAERLRVYLLDDGHRAEFRDYAEAVGARYLSRTDRRHAKAGNLNHALGVSDGDFVAVFDCDHVPVRSFLRETMGTFDQDARCALVQTPHHFFSPDPFERNLGTFRKVPGEGSLFYGLVQDGNDLWNAAYFCGSGAVLRRSALEAIGGIAEDTVTEDAHTALRLHRAGYTSAYVNTILAAGLATESLADHVAQRVRWARGMAQIFRIDNPLTGRGLHWAQRLCYLNAMLHFFSGLPRLVFLTAPLAYLYFEFHVLNAGTMVLAAFALPHLVQAAMANSALQKHYRHSLWNEAYEAALSWYTALPTLWALIRPQDGRFTVTAKGGLIEHSYFDWRLALPYLALVALNLIGVVIAVPRFLYWNAFEAETVVINLIWTLFNLTLLGTVLGVASESRQVRRSHRVDCRMAAEARLLDGTVTPVTVLDFSTGGLRVEAADLARNVLGATIELHLGRDEDRPPAIVSGQCVQSAGQVLRIELDPMTPAVERRYIEATFAHPTRWRDWHDTLPADRPLRSLAEVLSFGFSGYVRVAGLLRAQFGRRLRRPSSAQVQ